MMDIFVALVVGFAAFLAVFVLINSFLEWVTRDPN